MILLLYFTLAAGIISGVQVFDYTVNRHGEGPMSNIDGISCWVFILLTPANIIWVASL